MSVRTQKNIMFITPCFGVGGLEQVILNLINSLDRSKYNPSFCTLLEPDTNMHELMRKLDIPYYIINKRTGIDFILPIKIRNILIREEIDLVNSHDIGATIYSAIAAKLAGIKKVIHTDHSQILTKKKYSKLYKILFNKWVSFSITVSQDLQNYLTTKFQVHANRIKTIPNGIDIDKFISNKDISYLKRSFNIGENERIIGSIGRLTEQKGFEYLLRAYKILLKDNQDTRLVIVGDGDLKDSLMSFSRNLQIQEKVVFAGIRQDIANLLSLFNIFVLSSLWEGQPITIMEAMAAGKPIIATDVGGNGEILKHGKLGLIVKAKDPDDLADSIKLLLNDHKLAAKFGCDAQSFSRKHLSHTSMVRKYEKVFDSVIAEN